MPRPRKSARTRRPCRRRHQDRRPRSAVRNGQEGSGTRRRPLRQRGSGQFLPLGAISEEHFDQTFALNVKGLLFTVQKALPLFTDGGSIILNASMAGSKGMPAFSVYAASKAAVRSFARGWASDLKDRKIRVNAVSAGVIPTEGYSKAGLTQEQIAGFAAQMIPAIPAGRVGSPEEIAKAVLFLASDDASFVNGIDLFVDGGMAQI